MTPNWRWLDLASIVLALAVSEGPITVSSKLITSGPLYVGQAIEILVRTEAASSRLEVTPPKFSEADALLYPTTGPDQPATETRFVIIPRHPGPMSVGPFRVQDGDQSAATRPIRLTVQKLPTDSRSGSFLGGIGGFELRGEATPSTIRLGQSITYRIQITGPAAWGSERSPDLKTWSTISPGLRVEPQPTEWEPSQTPTRTFVYKLRPARAGRLILPPVTVAALDPKSSRYSTKVTTGLTIEVEPPPGFDPSQIQFEAEPRVNRRWIVGMSAAGLVIVLGSAGAAGWLVIRRKRRLQRVDPALLAVELIQTLALSQDPARSVNEALSTFFQKVAQQPPGALTPLEAAARTERLTSDPGLIRRAHDLIVWSDRVQFGVGVPEETAGLIAEGQAILTRLGAIRSPDQ